LRHRRDCTSTQADRPDGAATNHFAEPPQSKRLLLIVDDRINRSLADDQEQ
jgi:hypothetical protein